MASAKNNPITAALNQVAKNLAAAQSRLQQALQNDEAGKRIAKNALIRLQTVPGKPHYPIQFTTVKQRRAFFASDGFGRGIPAPRSQPPHVTEAWDSEFIPTKEGGILALTNDDPAMEFIQGARAQGYHQLTGWVQVDDVEQEAFAEMSNLAVAEWFEVSDPLKDV